ncbi:MAG TPA: lysozyme inhibitor LprI family protein [Cytophaga sp.]|nr:lysozyme inhibitor LprI family protein [Cytophaga sp.]
MVQATNEAEKEYDLLLNKYYKLLLNKLESNDKAILQEAQRNWIKFRDSEVALIHLLSDEKYSGGGTIQSIINAATYLGMTRKRVIELMHHLVRN